MIAPFRRLLAILHALGMFVADLFKSWFRLEAECGHRILELPIGQRLPIRH
jgi:hypothetical protein